jgi:hypothetical protein
VPSALSPRCCNNRSYSCEPVSTAGEAACMSFASLAVFLSCFAPGLSRDSPSLLGQSSQPQHAGRRYTRPSTTQTPPHRVPYLFFRNFSSLFLQSPPFPSVQAPAPTWPPLPVVLPVDRHILCPSPLAGPPRRNPRAGILRAASQNARAEAAAPFAVVQTTRPRGGGQRDGCFLHRRRGRRAPSGAGRRRRHQSGGRPAGAARGR